MAQLKNLTFHLPCNNHRQNQAFTYIAHLLAAAPNTATIESSLHLGVEPSLHKFPAICFRASTEVIPKVTFDTQHTVLLNSTPESLRATRKELSLEEFNLKFAPHIKAVDHVGINIPKVTEDAADKDTLVYFLATSCNTYTYPTGEPWFFMIPSTKNEYKGEISDFSRTRQPKFELVLDATYPGSLIQIDFATDLRRAEAEALLPDPYGITLPGLENHFRSVFVAHPWTGLEIRIDIRFAADKLNEWSTGKWLVNNGKRLK